MRVRPKNKLGQFFYKLGGFFAYLRMMYLEGFYGAHIKIRYLHDKTYEKGGAYKKWSDKSYSQAVHKTLFLSFVISFIFFNLLGTLFPYIFNPAKPKIVKAGNTTVTWTTQDDFDHNASAGGIDNDVNWETNRSASVNLPAEGGVKIGLNSGGENPTPWSQKNSPSFIPWQESQIVNVSYGGNEYVYMARGYGTQSFARYLVGSNSWEARQNVPYATGAGFRMVYPGGDFIYATIGGNNYYYYKYSIPNNTWTRIADTLMFASSASTGLVYPGSGNYIYYVGHAGATVNLYRYSITGNSWELEGTFNIGDSYDSQGDNIYILTHSTGILKKYTISTKEMVTIKTATAGETWSGLSISNNPNRIYSYHNSTGKLSYLDLTTNQWVDLLAAGAPTGSYNRIEYSSTSDVLYISNMITSASYGGLFTYTLPQPYFTNATVGDTDVGLRLDTGGKKAGWSTLNWAAGGLTSTYNFQIQVRPTNVLGSGSYLNPNTGVVDSWFTVNTGTSGNITLHSSITDNKTTGFEIKIKLNSDGKIGTASLVLSSISVTYDTLEEPSNSNLSLTKTTGDTLYNSSGTAITAGVAGGYTNETAIKITATGLTCTNCGTYTNIRPEVEVKPLDPPEFDGTGTISAEPGRDYAIVTGLNFNVSYHIRVRAIDDQGRASGWTSYGNNAEDVADFTIERTSPTGTITINNGDTYTKVNGVDLTISASDTGGSNISKMRFSNYGSSGWSEWEDYATTRHMILAAGADGLRTVYAQFKDNAGNTSHQFMHTSKANFDGGTRDNTYATAAGDLTLMPVLPDNTSDNGNGTYTTTIYPDGSDGVVGACSGNYRVNVGGTPNIGLSNDSVECNTGLFYVNRTFQKFSLNNISGTINSAILHPYLNQVFEPMTDALLDHIPDYGTLDTTDYNIAAYQENVATLFNTADTVGFGDDFNVTAKVRDDLNNSRSFSSYRYKLASEYEDLPGGYNIAYSEDNPKTYMTVTWTPSVLTYPSSGSLESSYKDNSVASYYGKITWGSSIPGAAGADTVKFQVASNNDNTTWNFIGPDGTGASYYTTPGTQLHTSHNGHRYIKYKAFLSTASSSVTPILTDTNIEVMGAITDTINIDKTAPTNVSGLSSYSNSGKTVPITSTNWYAYTGPYFEWNANGESDLAGYKYCFASDISCTPDTPIGTTSYTSDLSSSNEGRYYFRLSAYDTAGNLSTPVVFVYGFDSTAPEVVAGFNAPVNEATETTITLHWDEASDSGSDITGYILERKRYDAGAWSGPTYGTFNLSPKTSLTHTDMGLDNGFRYNYRIKAINGAGMAGDWATLDASTVDTKAPTDPSAVTATACDGTAGKCSNIANKGFEIKLSWTASSDTGVGLTGYKIYRKGEANSNNTSDFMLVGYLDVDPVNAPVTTVYYDNDANNDAAASDATKGSIKSSATSRLNDYTNYHYRVVAMDENGINSDIITTDPLNPLVATTTNYSAAQTPDVTAPAIPTSVSAAPTGVDDENNEPPTQGMTISWTAPTDRKANGRIPEGLGTGVLNYEVWRAAGNISGPTESFVKIAENIVPASYTDTGLNEDSYYWYKIKAKDVAGNISLLSEQSSARTKNSQVPTTPSNVTATAVTGNPNTNTDVGTKIYLSFNGSKIVGTGNRIDGYKVYRSTTNLSTEGEWTALTPVHTFSSLNIAPGVQDGQRTFTDTVPTDATTYYYKVMAYGWNNSNQENVESGISNITVGTLHSGWETSPDATEPSMPASVAVKDIHGRTSMVRNIITWSVIPNSKRGVDDDFARYEVYRYETNLGIATAAKIAEKTDIGDNYHVDGITYANISEVTKDYSYYVIAVDNAGTDFTYPNGTIINNISNVSTHEEPDNINPGSAHPTITSSYNISGTNYKAKVASTGVSSGVIEWTTNQNADSLVEYRRAGTSDKFIAAGDTELRTTHQVTISSLSASTAYEYRIRSVNSLGNKVEASGLDVQPLTTSNFAIGNINVDTTTTTATVNWTTGNVAADSSVEYKIEALGQSEASKTAGDPTLSTSHEVVVMALKPDTNYTYKIRSVTADKYVSETNFLSFRTKPYDASQFVISPSASNVAEQNITATTAKIVWNTAIATTTWVDYGTSAGAYNQSSGDDKFNTVHVVELLNLTPGNSYYYRVRGTDSNNVEYTSKEYFFTAVLKPEIQNLKADVNSAYTANISFGTNVDTEASVSYGKDGAFDLKAGTSEIKKGHVIELKNLEDGTTYSAIIEVKDKLGNTTKSNAITFNTPIDTTGPKIEAVKIDLLPMGESDETAQAIISWSTDKPSTTKIEYDEGVIGGKYSKSSIEDASLNNSHTVIIKELNAGTTYHFKIVTKDKRGNLTSSNDYTFVTPTKEKSVLQLIIKSLEETFSWVRNVGSFFKGVGNKTK